ncbi:PREDICTED: leukotriene A-4 hydrolase-like [Branchiostoma belcheri]|uniref:Leukotriene A(4) hydrolase n=1 Tax=Branchiostoma belcheri TaxID=7741 RepID=A0A6P4ZH65_BRABE|nr:PREDICTED: leukotriene A-4 hydrolase-like [Branchiostoma belcheri]
MADPCSLSNPQACRTTNMALHLVVDFDKKVLRGSATLDVEVLEEGVEHVVLDTRELTIHGVEDVSTAQPLQFQLKDQVAPFGSPLQISLPVNCHAKGSKCQVKVSYETAPSSSALQWLSPQQTAGQQHPYLFSQCQAIHARSMLPCQDTPSTKITYQAEVSVPKPLVALMSAQRGGEETDPTDQTRTLYKFDQKVQMPTYLIAIVAGALESRDIDHRTKVWSEKELVDKSAYEFAETETMLKTAEDLLGPYVWGQYDLLVLPPSFPYGGMENPCLTFVTPTLLAGDRSLANVVAHEISHSWTGNLVTNRTWEHFWLNEGHTVFVERKIAGRMHGEKTRQFAALGGWKDLYHSVQTFGETNPLTNLVPRLEGVDPDDAFSSVPYEKGFTLLYYLEELVGGPEKFEPFLRKYIDTFKYKCLDTEEWKAFLLDYFKKEVSEGLFDQVDWNAWLHTPGMPPVKPSYDTTLADVCSSLCQRWSQATPDQLDQFTPQDLQDMSPGQKTEFLAQLLLEPPLSIQHIEKMDQVYGMSANNNSEIKFRWLRLGIRAEWEGAVDPALKFVTVQGRMKFVRPLYRDLYGFDKARDKTLQTFQQNRPFMHSTTASLVAKDLNIQ